MDTLFLHIFPDQYTPTCLSFKEILFNRTEAQLGQPVMCGPVDPEAVLNYLIVGNALQRSTMNKATNLIVLEPSMLNSFPQIPKEHTSLAKVLHIQATPAVT